MCAAVDGSLSSRASPRWRTAPRAETAARPETTAGTAELFVQACLAARHDPCRLAIARALAPTTETGWQAVEALARQERLSPLLYRVVSGRDVVPISVEKAWQTVYHESLRLSALWSHEIETLVNALSAVDVPVLLLKGAALGDTIYGNPALRPMTDLDLLVHQSDVPVALETLRRLGYRTDEPFGFFAEVEAIKLGPPRRLIDLHWTLIGIPHYQVTVPTDWVWGKAQPVAVGSTTAWVLGPEIQLLHLCAHLVLQHRDAERHLLWRYDVAELLHRREGELDWPALFAIASRCDLVLSLQEVLPGVVDAFAAPIPADVLVSLAGLDASRQEVRIHRTFRSGTWSPSQTGLLGLVTLPAWRSRLAYLSANVFPSFAYMRWRYQVSGPALLPFCYVRRWLEGLRGIAGLVDTLLRRPPVN